ncbi:MAG TPA: exonuclease domain-containing protein [Thermoleophilia bacterium]|nr:exonuclease domain-containing protein [Thermoleophilia bacterium]
MAANPLGIVVLDTETTALDPRDGRLIDIGAVRLGPGLAVEERFTTLLDPGVPIPLAITRLVGLSDDDVRDATSPHEGLSALRDFVGDGMLVAHNAAFDRQHLAAGAFRAGLPPLTNQWFDTLEAALLLYPEFDSHALISLAERFGCARRAHRALPDAETAADVFRRLCARAAGLGAEERSLLTAIGWAPLRTLEAFEILPDAPPPPLTAEQHGGAPATPPATLPVAADGWVSELGSDEADCAPGLAARMPGFRRREGQLQLAAAASDVFAAGGVGLFEAGTGSGKSLAYLLPAAFHSAATGRRVIVSTKTKALQRQLAAHELPLVATTLPAGWRWALLMGRENYLCRRRLEETVAAEGESLANVDRSLALAYLMGRARRGDVDLSALPYRATLELPALAGLARELRSARATCLGRHCPKRRGCYWRLARSRADAAHLVCVNHALLLTGREALPSFEDVVIDEAHFLYHEATEAFSERVDAAALGRLLSDLRPGGQRPLARRLRTAAGGAEPGDARAVLAAADACDHAAEVLPDLVRALGEALIALSRVARAEDDGDVTADRRR